MTHCRQRIRVDGQPDGLSLNHNRHKFATRSDRRLSSLRDSTNRAF
jgi:hypothetical protein